MRLKAGDMLVIPAGVRRRRLSAGDVKAIGAYPRGQSHYDMKREGRRIPKVTLPLTDPFYGQEGPLTAKWPLSPALSQHTKV